MTTLQTALAVATAATASGTLAAGKHTPVDATSAALTMTLPTPATIGARLRVEKIDASANVVTVSGTIRGGASTISLAWQFESVELVAESLTSWRPSAGHKTKAALDGAYAPLNLPSPTLTPTPATNAMATRTLGTINPFLRWLTANGVKGALSEMSVPTTDTERWSEVAETWWRVVDDYDLPVLQWTGDGGLYGTFINEASGNFTFHDSAHSLLRHRRVGVLRGFMAGGVVGVSPPAGFSNSAPATGSNWYPPAPFYARLAAAGVNTVRISTRWEAIQPTLGGALNATELARVTGAIALAAAAGLKCVVDLHNYASYVTAGGTYHLGDGNLTQAHLVDVWTKLSTALKGNAGVGAYELMNEPAQMPGGSYTTTTSGTGTLIPGATITVASTAAFPASPRSFGIALTTSGGTAYCAVTVASATTLTVNSVASGTGNTWASGAAVASPNLAWEDATQAVVTAIRGNADTTEVWVAGYYFQNASMWPSLHPQAWITDSASATRYVAHNYWSTSSTGDSNYADWATETGKLVFTGGGGYAPLAGAHPNMGSGALTLPLQAGETTMPRFFTTDTNAPNSGYIYATTFLAGRTEVINNVAVMTGGTAAAATPTLCRIGVYSVNPDQSLTLLAATANDTTLFSTASTYWKRALTTPFYKQAGQFYAVGVLVVSAAAMPKYRGTNQVFDSTVWPWPCFRVTGQSDLPSYVARGNTGQGFDVFYAALTP